MNALGESSPNVPASTQSNRDTNTGVAPVRPYALPRSQSRSRALRPIACGVKERSQICFALCRGGGELSPALMSEVA
jgi:hypothetical protein